MTIKELKDMLSKYDENTEIGIFHSGTHFDFVQKIAGVREFQTTQAGWVLYPASGSASDKICLGVYFGYTDC